MRSINRGSGVADRINARCMYEMEWNGGCPLEVFVSSQDWQDLAAYFDSKATYQLGPPSPLVGIKMHIDGINQPVEVKDIGRIVLV